MSTLLVSLARPGLCLLAALLSAAPLSASQQAAELPAATTPASESAAAAHSPDEQPAPVSGQVDPAALAADEMARIDGALSIPATDFFRYLATVQARHPDGEAALQQVLTERLLAERAGQAGLDVSAEEVARFTESLEAELRLHGGGSLAEAVTVNVEDEELRAALRLSLLHEKLVRAADGLSPEVPLSRERLGEWLDEQLAAAGLTEAPLEDEAAAHWQGGAIPKELVGRRLAALLPREELAGVLTEMIGVQLVRRASVAAGVGLTTAEATREILLRDAALRSQSGAGDTSYEEFAEVVLKRSLAELLASEKFSTELLLRLLAESRWSDDAARAFFERHEQDFAEQGVAGPWEAARGAVWRELRQSLYRDLFRNSTILRRY